jgi:hypothetical protein
MGSEDHKTTKETLTSYLTVMATTSTDLLSLYKASAKEPEVVSVPLTKYLMIDGIGDPNTSPAFQSAVETLYGLAYTIKFGRKKRGLKSDYKITPLEGLWWADNMNAFGPEGDRSKWKWTIMLAQPEFIMSRDVAVATKELKEKKDLPLLPQVRFERYKEGKSVQIMHVGPYSAEGPTIERLHKYAQDHGLAIRGKHHEIYLGDPRRARPDRLKTILRQPVEKNGKHV